MRPPFVLVAVLLVLAPLAGGGSLLAAEGFSITAPAEGAPLRPSDQPPLRWTAQPGAATYLLQAEKVNLGQGDRAEPPREVRIPAGSAPVYPLFLLIGATGDWVVRVQALGPSGESLATAFRFWSLGAVPPGTIRGKLLWGGEGVPGIAVALAKHGDPGHAAIRRATSGPGGSFEFTGLAPGSYQLVLNGHWGSGQRNPAYDQGGSWELPLKAAEGLSLDWHLLKTDLVVALPAGRAAGDPARSSFSWKDYPGARYYSLVLLREDDPEAIAFGLRVEGGAWTAPKALLPGRYTFNLFAHDATGRQIAIGANYFELP